MFTQAFFTGNQGPISLIRHVARLDTKVACRPGAMVGFQQETLVFRRAIDASSNE